MCQENPFQAEHSLPRLMSYPLADEFRWKWHWISPNRSRWTGHPWKYWLLGSVARIRGLRKGRSCQVYWYFQLQYKTNWEIVGISNHQTSHQSGKFYTPLIVHWTVSVNWLLKVEIHPYLSQVQLKKFCDERDITLTAYSPLGNPGSQVNTASDKDKLLKDVVVNRLADKYKKSPGQILLKFAVIFTFSYSTFVDWFYNFRLNEESL